MFRKKMVMVTGILTAASILAGCGAAGSSTGESASSSGSAQSEAQSQSEEDSGAQTEISGESESASFRAEEGKTSEGVMKKIDEAGEAGKIANMSAEEYAYSDAYMEFLSARSDAMAESGKYASIFQPFYEKSMQEILKDDGKSNVVYSPANVYIELAMLAQCTGGDTQKQILDLLGVKDASSLPAAVNAMLQANTARMNALAAAIAQDAQHALAEDTARQIAVPLGAALKAPFLAHFGPRIRVTLTPVGAVSVSFHTEFESAGINQTRHKIYLQLHAAVQLVLPTGTQPVSVDTQVLIAESIIVGGVPQSYINVPESEMLNFGEP